MIWVRWCLLKSIMKKKFKNGISLITIPVPIVWVFQGCVISSCWYFAQALLRILITACLYISLFFWSADWALWSAGDRRRHVFLISATERPWEGIWMDYFFAREEQGTGGGEGITWFLGKQKGASFVIGNPKKKSLQKNKKNWEGRLTLDYEQSLFFFCSPSSKTRDTQMATRVTDSARRERHVSSVSRLRRSRARALLSLNLKKKRDWSQSRLTCVGRCQFESI